MGYATAVDAQRLTIRRQFADGRRWLAEHDLPTIGEAADALLAARQVLRAIANHTEYLCEMLQLVDVGDIDDGGDTEERARALLALHQLVGDMAARLFQADQRSGSHATAGLARALACDLMDTDQLTPRPPTGGRGGSDAHAHHRGR